MEISRLRAELPRLGGDTLPTHIKAYEGWLFLAEVIDQFSCQVVAWSLREDMRRDTAIDTRREVSLGVRSALG